MLEKEIIPLFQTWREKPESGNAALMRSKLSGHVPETVLDQYAEVVALDAFSAGFRAACQFILPVQTEKGAADEAQEEDRH